MTRTSFFSCIFVIFGVLAFLMVALINERTLGITNVALRGCVLGFDFFLIFVGGMLIFYREKTAREVILLLITPVCLFVFIEGCYRIFDPFLYFGSFDSGVMGRTYSRYDDVLGWRGVPNREEWLVTENSKVLVRLNSLGFRDIEHSSAIKPAVVFLGDSFTWGFEVEFDDMFVNMLREKLPDIDIYNLAHSGYGTDQEFLTFKRWDYNGDLRFVVLMFSENDAADNGAMVRNHRQKPKFMFKKGILTLMNVPVPQGKGRDSQVLVRKRVISFKDRVRGIIFRSHFLHDVYYRIKILQENVGLKDLRVQNKKKSVAKDSYPLTKRIINELKREVEKRGARLIVVAIPAKGDLLAEGKSVPYQDRVEAICRDLKIAYLDLWPYFKKAHSRLYFRYGIHTNKFGNAVIMRALYGYLKESGYLYKIAY